MLLKAEMGKKGRTWALQSLTEEILSAEGLLSVPLYRIVHFHLSTSHWPSNLEAHPNKVQGNASNTPENSGTEGVVDGALNLQGDDMSSGSTACSVLC